MSAGLTVLSPHDAFPALWPPIAVELQLELRLVRSAEEAAAAASSVTTVLVVTGMEPDAESCLRELRAAGIAAPLAVGSCADHRFALMLVQAGAADYFLLPAELDLLRSRLADLAHQVHARAARARLAASGRSAFDFSAIVGRSAQMRAALDRAARIIPHERATVLITGETGTGKELLAHAIHYNGPRAAAPFVEINCAAIPAQLLESELFGHERGAFTDARAAKPGLFEAAHGGTLFLDEIGHLPFELQGKILRALEEKRIRRLGEVALRDVDVRIMAATHVDLAAAVRRGDFREDLFYRLSIIPIHLPPLRERGDDVLLLAEHFLHVLAQQYRLPAPALSPDLRRVLLTHSWPGNVRELRNVLERVLLLGDGTLRPLDFLPHNGSAPAEPAGHLPFPASLAEIERHAARLMIERLEGNKSAAAEALGISRSRLYRLMDPAAIAE